MKQTKKCLSSGCERRIDPLKLMCVQHWKVIPQAVRSECQVRINGWKDRASAESYLADFLKGCKDGDLSGVFTCR